MDMPVSDIKGVKMKYKQPKKAFSMLSMLPAIPRMMFYAKQTAGEFSERFKSPLLRMLLRNTIGPDYLATGMIFTMATFVSGDGGYPEGGSLGMANRMAKYFKELGGTIEFGRKVSRVSVKNGTADGIIIEDKLIPADAVIVTQDTLAAIDTLFETPINEPWTQEMKRCTVPMLDTFLCVGVEADLSGLPENVTFNLKEPLMCGGEAVTSIGINNYSGYKGYAPEGCTAITSAVISDSYDFWKKCKENGTMRLKSRSWLKPLFRFLLRSSLRRQGKLLSGTSRLH
jgi:hypothetical protein